jgi:hypothetical protein
MSVLLYVIGALAIVAGASAIAFGVPIKEFSLGDTLIISGTVSLIGGLVVIGLAAAVSQLHRVADMLGARPLARSGRPADVLEGSRVPFPPRPKSEGRRAPAGELPPFVPAPVEEPPVAVAAREPVVEEAAAPAIRNPALPLPEEALEEAVKSPPPPFRFPDLPKPPAAKPAEPPPPRTAAVEPPPTAPSSSPPGSPPGSPPWRKPALPPRPEAPQPSYFDAMWKDRDRAAPLASPIEPEPTPEPEFERPPSERGTAAAAGDLEEPPPPPEPVEETPAAEEEPPRAVAVLKSGVVDGMGYTLYVDGSIEAELPDGTLRFASINELRAHLEKTS